MVWCGVVWCVVCDLWGLGFGVWGVGFGVLGLGCGVCCVVCGVCCVVCGVWGVGCFGGVLAPNVSPHCSQASPVSGIKFLTWVSGCGMLAMGFSLRGLDSHAPIAQRQPRTRASDF